MLLTKAIQHRGGMVRAGIVNEKKMPGRTCTNPFKECLRVKARGLVVTRNDKCEQLVCIVIGQPVRLYLKVCGPFPTFCY